MRSGFAVRFLPKLGRETSHGLFLGRFSGPSLLICGPMAGHAAGHDNPAAPPCDVSFLANKATRGVASQSNAEREG